MLSVLPFVEVMDKELTVHEAWLVAATIAVGGFGLGRWRPWLGAFALIAVAGVALAVALELLDAPVRAAVEAEAGASYPMLVYGGLAVAALVTVFGMWRGVIRLQSRAL